MQTHTHSHTHTHILGTQIMQTHTLGLEHMHSDYIAYYARAHTQRDYIAY
jgi:hypothetical protein